MLQAFLLDLPNLIADKPSALHVAPQLSQRVRRDRLALRRSQTVKAPDGPFQFGIESADAQPNQRCLHSVDNPTLLADEALAARALGILLMWGSRLPCSDYARRAQPAEKSTFEQLGVETVGLRSPMLARHRHTPHPSSREGHHSTVGGYQVSPMCFDPLWLSRCGDLPGPSEFGAVNPDAVHDHGQSARQGPDRFCPPEVPGTLHRPGFEPGPFRRAHQ